VGRDPFHQTRLLKAPFSLALNTAREGASTASLGNLCQGLTTLRAKNFFLYWKAEKLDVSWLLVLTAQKANHTLGCIPNSVGTGQGRGFCPSAPLC